MAATNQQELAEYIGRYTYMSGAQSKAAHQIMAASLVKKLADLGFVIVTTPVKPTVLIVREPDSPTSILVSPPDSVQIISADLGSSFDGKPDPSDPEQVEVARSIAERLIDGTAHLSDEDEVRMAAHDWANTVTEGLPFDDDEE